MNANANDIPRILSVLRETAPPGDRVLSLYLDTSPKRVIGQGHLLFFRDACKALRPRLSEEERDAFEAARTSVEQYLTGEPQPTHPGLAVFAAPSPSYFHAVGLPTPPREDLAWGERPALAELQTLLDENERIAIVLVDKERTRLFTVYLGVVEEHREFADAVPGKHHKGGWHLLSQTRFQRHHEDRVMRHAKHTAAALMDTLRAHPFDRLLLAGPDEAVAALRQHLPRPLRSRLAGTLHLELFASDADVLRAVHDAAEGLERTDELKEVDALLEAAFGPHVVLGLQPTLAAASDGRVHRLFIADTFSGMGGECQACGRLVAGPGPCPTCGGPTATVADLRERLVECALAQGAAVETVSGEAARRLVVHDGVGAWTRYGELRAPQPEGAVA